MRRFQDVPLGGEKNEHVAAAQAADFLNSISHASNRIDILIALGVLQGAIAQSMKSGQVVQGIDDSMVEFATTDTDCTVSLLYRPARTGI